MLLVRCGDKMLERMCCQRDLRQREHEGERQGGSSPAAQVFVHVQVSDKAEHGQSVYEMSRAAQPPRPRPDSAGFVGTDCRIAVTAGQSAGNPPYTVRVLIIGLLRPMPTAQGIRSNQRGFSWVRT